MRKLTPVLLGIALLAGPLFATATTTDDLIQDLLRQIQQLQQILAQLQGQGNNAPQSCVVLNNNLYLGLSDSDVNGEVTKLQQFLAADRSIYPEGKVTGYFGPVTERAVKRYQVRNGIVFSGSPDTTGYGIVGPKTRAYMARGCATSAVGFTASPASGPVPLTVSFRAVAGDEESFSVDFGDGTLGQMTVIEGGVARGVSHTYASAGTYTANLMYQPSMPICPSGMGCPVVMPSSRTVGSATITVTAAAGPFCEHAAPPAGCYWKSGATCNDDQLVCSSIASCAFNGQTVAHGSSVTAYQNSSVAYGAQCVSETRTCTNGTLSGLYQNASCTVGVAQSCTLDGITVQNGQSATFYSSRTVQSPSTCAANSRSRTCTNGTLSGAFSYQYRSCSATYPSMPNPPQMQMINGFNVYSAFPVMFSGQLRMYFGGWYNDSDRNDHIYVADCPNPQAACTNIRKVIDAVANGYVHVNDPTIVLHPAMGSSPAYYIMYTTVAASASDIGGVYYSTSWADDGINWSKPTLLIANYWLPSTVWKNDHVELYANDFLTDGRVARFDLGSSGISVGSPVRIQYDNAASVPPLYSNVDVSWRPSLNAYQMVAERALSTTPGAASVIDYLSSSDGVNWHLEYPAIIAAAAGQFRVGTPTQHPDSAQWVYFASTAQNDSMGFKIYFARWSTPTAMAPKQTQLASALAALEAVLQNILKMLQH